MHRQKQTYHESREVDVKLIDFGGKIPIVKWVTIGVAYGVLSEVGSSIRRGDQQVQKDRDISARNI